MNYDHIITTDGETYINVDDVREVLGIVDEYVDIFGVIKKLKEERDELKEKCDKLKKRANTMYGASCGYSEYTGGKAPAFICDVISYSWEFGSITDRDLMDRPTYRVRNDSIRVELNLTPTANYKGTLDLEDLKKYIQEYGREKKLGIVESVDYQNAKAARAELAHLYKKVLGKEKLDRDLSPHEIMKAILDEYKRVRDAQFASDQCLRSVYMHVCDGPDCKVSDIYAAPDKLADEIITRYNAARMLSRLETLKEIDAHIDKLCDECNVVQPNRESTTKERLDYIFAVLGDYRGMRDAEWNRVEKLRKEKQSVEDSLTELRAKICEIYRSVVDDEWDEYRGYTSIAALNDIKEEYERVVHNFEERTADWHKAQQELDRYRLAVGSLLGIPKEARDDINAIERAFTFSKKRYESLKEFRNDVCEIFDIPSNMTDNYILKEIHDVVDRYDELEDFRADICGALDIEGMLGTPQQNDKYILDQVEKMRNDGCKPTVFRNDVAKAVGLTVKDSDSDIVNRVMEIRKSHDKLARLRSSICTALCLGHESCDGNIIGRIHMNQDCHNKLCNDYIELRKAIWAAMDRKPETLPEETARLVGAVAELKRGEKLLTEFRDDVAKAIDIVYPAANNVILNNVKYICKDRKDAYDMVAKLNDYVTALEKAREDLQKMLKDILGIDSCEKDTVVSAIKALKSVYNSLRNDYDEVCEGYTKLKKDYDELKKSTASIDQLRQKWHDRYESEHERANGEHKRAEKLNKEVRDWTIRCNSAERALNARGNEDVALTAFKNECRKLKDEKAKVIEALGQDIWDDCLK